MVEIKSAKVIVWVEYKSKFNVQGGGQDKSTVLEHKNRVTFLMERKPGVLDGTKT